MVSEPILGLVIPNLPYPTGKGHYLHEKQQLKWTHALNIIRKLYQWILHQLVLWKTTRRISTCVSLRSTYNKTRSVLEIIVTSYGKYVFFLNVKYQRHWFYIGMFYQWIFYRYFQTILPFMVVSGCSLALQTFEDLKRASQDTFDSKLFFFFLIDEVLIHCRNRWQNVVLNDCNFRWIRRYLFIFKWLVRK